MTFKKVPPPRGRLYSRGIVAQALGLNPSAINKATEAYTLRPYCYFGKRGVYGVREVAVWRSIPLTVARQLLELAAENARLRYELAPSKKMTMLWPIQRKVDREVAQWKTDTNDTP